MATPRVPAFRWLPVSALAAGCALAAGLLLVQPRPTAKLTTAPRPTQVARVAPRFIPALPASLKIPDENQLREWSVKLDEPLEHEMQLVVSDARSAVNSLENSFVPQKLRDTLFASDH
jgi:hypothetical protein